MGVEENKATIERFLSWEAFFGEESLDVVNEVFASDVVLLGPKNEAQRRGPDAIDLIIEELKGYRGKDGEITILEQFAEGESVVTRYTLQVEETTYGGVTVSRFADGKIREYSVLHPVTWDSLEK